jgi:predicted ester cyclase
MDGMAHDDPKHLVHRYIDEVWNARASALPFFAPHYRRYVSAGAAPLTGAEQQVRISGYQAAFPDLEFVLEDLFGASDRVVFRATMRGTHQGAFRGIAPTGKSIAIAVLDIVRVENGLFAEHWGGPDLYDLLTQVGFGYWVLGIGYWVLGEGAAADFVLSATADFVLPGSSPVVSGR